MSERQRRISDIVPVYEDGGEVDGPPENRRFALDADVTFLQPANALGVAIDADASGMRVVVDTPISVGARCIAVVQLADGGETHERAQVISSERSAQGWIIGLEFAS